MACTNVTLNFGAIPPPKKPPKPKVVAPPPEEGEEGAEGEEPPAEEAKEEEPEAPPEPQPRSVLLNSNVPPAILLHHARKQYVKEESHTAKGELPISMETPCSELDFGTEDGAVIGLGSEESLSGEDPTAPACLNEKLQPRQTYVLLKKEVDEEGNATFKPLCEKYKSVTFA